MENSVQFSKKMEQSTHPFFQELIKKPSEESYLNGLCRSLKALKIGGPSKPKTSKRKPLELPDNSNSSTEEEH